MGRAAPNGVSASGKPPLGDTENAIISGIFSSIGVSQPFAFRGAMRMAIWASLIDALTVTAGSTAYSVATGTGLAAGDAVNSVLTPPGTTIGTLAGAAGVLNIPAITLYGITNGFNAGSPGVITGLNGTNGLLGASVTGPGIAANTTVTAILKPYVSDGIQPIRGGTVKGNVQISNAPTQQSTPIPVPFTFTPTGNAILASGTDAAASFTGGAVAYTGSVQLECSFDGGSTWIVCNTTVDGTLAIWAAGTPINITFGEPESQVLYRLNCTAFSASNPINYRISQTGAAATSLSIGQNS